MASEEKKAAKLAAREEKKKNKPTDGNWIKRHKGLFIFLCIAVVVGGLVTFLVIKIKNAVSQAQEMIMNMTQMSTTVERMDLVSSISVTGKIASADSRTITDSTLQGKKITNIYYSVGDYVEEGDVIIAFDVDDLQDDVDDTTASVDLSNKRSNHSVKAAYDAYKTAQDKYNDPDDGYAYFTRQADDYLQVYYTNLGKQGEAQAEYDKEQSSANNMELQLAKQASEDARKLYKYYRDEAERLTKNVEDARYNYEVACAENNINKDTNGEQLDSVNNRYEAGQVIAPISGVITTLDLKEGDKYDGVSPLFVIQDNKNFIVTGSVDEYDISALSKGLKAIVKTDSTGDKELDGTLTFVAPTPTAATAAVTSAVASTGTSNSYKIEITLHDYDDNLRIGMTAKTSIILASSDNVLAVPYDCVQARPDGSHYVVKMNDDGTTEDIPVTIGIENDYYQEIIGDGVTEGMRIQSTASSAGAGLDFGLMFGMDGNGPAGPGGF